VEGVDVIIRNYCALEAMYALNDQLSDTHKEAIRGTMWSPTLEYRIFVMD